MFDENFNTEMFYHQSQKWLNGVMETPQRMYHYTSVEVLKNIIEGKCMYATHINFMNDWEEYQLGYRILTSKIKESIERNRSEFESNIGQQTLDEILNFFSDECLNVTTYNQIQSPEKFHEFRRVTLPEVYTICFCAEKDLLSQWAIYAKESGVGVEFDFTDFVFCDASLDHGEESKFCEKDWQSLKYYRYNRPHMINYSDQKMTDKLQEQITELIRLIKTSEFNTDQESTRLVLLMRRIATLYNLVPYCKMDKFKAESEIRVAFMRLEKWIHKKGVQQGENFETSVFYRTANKVLKPYIKIGWEALKEGAYPIKRIIVGPGENQEAVFRGLIHFIENQSTDSIPNCKGQRPFTQPMVDGSYMTCKGIIIQKSNIPYIFK